jgi:uroporphyrinogen-III synthase
LRVVVTRPEVSAARTADRLRSMGHEPVLLPLSKAIHRPRAATKAVRMPHSAIAATSAEALRALPEPELRAFIDIGTPLFTVGEATAAAARTLGFRRVHAGSSGGLELAELIASSQDGGDLPVLYLAGTPRAPAFEERLKTLGLSVQVCEVYEMTDLDYRPEDIAQRVAQPGAEAVLLYSRQAALRFFELAAPHAGVLVAMRILCISGRTAEGVPAAFRRHLRIAERPDEEALLALL